MAYCTLHKRNIVGVAIGNGNPAEWLSSNSAWVAMGVTMGPSINRNTLNISIEINTLVGYCPRYRALDFGHLIQMNKPDDVLVTVERVNTNAPTQLRLLCKFWAAWPSSFRPCQDSEYELINVEAERERSDDARHVFS